MSNGRRREDTHLLCPEGDEFWIHEDRSANRAFTGEDPWGSASLNSERPRFTYRDTQIYYTKGYKNRRLGGVVRSWNPILFHPLRFASCLSAHVSEYKCRHEWLARSPRGPLAELSPCQPKSRFILVFDARQAAYLSLSLAMSDAGSPLQLRDSMRKMRKRVVSVIRRGSSSKNVKSRTGSEEGEKLSNQSHRDESEHEHEHDEHEQEHEQELEHTPSHTNPNSATSSTHSLSRSAGSRPASPSPSTDKVQRKRSLVNLSFPRSPRKNKSKGESTPSSPHTRIRTFSSPDAPDGTPALGSEPGKLTVPIPARPRTLSHPLATSPIMPSSPDKDTDNTRPKSGHSRAASSPGTGAFGALASAASTLAAMAATHPGSLPTSKSPGPSPPPSVVLTPPAAETSTSLPTQIVESPITHPAPSEQPSSAPDVINTPDIPIVDGPKAEELDQPRDKADQDTSQREQPTVTPLIEREQPREPSNQGREPLPREQGHVGVRRAASAVGSEMGWSVLEPPQEEDETEEDVGASKVEQEKQVQVRVEEVVPSIAPSAVDVREPSNAEQVVEIGSQGRKG
ncbi:hypothetical protein AG1IA_00620 [Rhizoctonia solani AG-1 IA]|uniref:Uncharacterized protein n=1 Tax=Thanatephorus cucumeris (strain AG1-IA) TaxID=983506 RepID=L8X580_THACA|nr:hypothetical protein AG1IA_00620 [Rhizoctonia solani AG-1 IA]